MAKRTLALLGATTLTLAIALAAVFGLGSFRSAAAAGNTTAPTDQAGGQMAADMPVDLLSFMAATPGMGQSGDRQAQCQALVNNLATNLNLPPATLGAAVKKTLVQQVDAAQTAGKLNAQQAQAMKDKINQANDADLCASLPAGAKGMTNGGQGARPGMSGGAGMPFGMIQGDVLNAAAGYFGLTPDTFKQELQSKGSLQAVAAAHGKDNDAGKAGLKTALDSALRTALTNQGKTADQVNQMITMFDQQFDRLYTMPLGQFGQHGQGAPGQQNPRQRSPQATPTVVR